MSVPGLVASWRSCGRGESDRDSDCTCLDVLGDRRIVSRHDFFFFFFFQAEDGIRDLTVTGVQTCALPICGVGDISALATQAKIDTIKLPKIFLYPITVSPRMG